MGAIWNGAHPEDGSELRVENGFPKGADWPDLPEEPQLTSPSGPDAEIDPAFLADVAKRVYGNS